MLSAAGSGVDPAAEAIVWGGVVFILVTMWVLIPRNPHFSELRRLSKVEKLPSVRPALSGRCIEDPDVRGRAELRYHYFRSPTSRIAIFGMLAIFGAAMLVQALVAGFSWGRFLVLESPIIVSAVVIALAYRWLLARSEKTARADGWTS